MESAAPVTDSAFRMQLRDCPVCGIPANRVLGLRGGAYHRYHLGVATPIVQCERCELIFPNPFPYAVDVSDLYGDPAKYFAGVDEQEKVDRYRPLVRDGLKRSTVKKPRILDVGSGRGELLRAARAEGVADVVGLELSHPMVEHSRDKHGLVVHKRTIEQYAVETDETFDIIFMNAVIEHVYEPDAMMAAARKLTRPGSLMYIDLPREPHLLSMIGNRLNRLRGSPAVFNLAPTFPPYHVFGFSPKTMRLLLDKHGFDMTDLLVWADPRIPTSNRWKDRLVSTVATQINRAANVLKLAANMCGWAVRR